MSSASSPPMSSPAANLFNEKTIKQERAETATSEDQENSNPQQCDASSASSATSSLRTSPPSIATAAATSHADVSTSLSGRKKLLRGGLAASGGIGAAAGCLAALNLRTLEAASEANKRIPALGVPVTSASPTTQRVSPQLAASSLASSLAAAAAVSSGVGYAASAGASVDPIAESRTIYKVKRFLYTLIQFGMDISPETGEKVKELVFNLVAGTLSASDFHQVLQEVTNFPLRPFVLPFLKANIPLLSRDIASLAVLSCQSPLQYLRSHQQNLLLEMPGSQVTEANDIFHSESTTSSGNPTTSRMGLTSNKRRASGESLEGGEGNALHDGFLTAKRLRSNPPPEDSGDRRQIRQQQRVYPQPWHSQRDPQLQAPAAAANTGGDRGHNILEINGSGSTASSGAGGQHEDEWKNIHVMLNCILGMVDKTKRALAILQQRQHTSTSSSSGQSDPFANEVSATSNSRRHPNPQAMNELLAATLRSTEERVTEVRRRAEEAVQEVKRVAMTELQRAVALAEQRAIESVASERIKMERLLLETAARKGITTASEDSNKAPSPCWNCGRPGSETCSGCNAARYCSRFCQHKDWESHHKVCSTTKEARKRLEDAVKTSDSKRSPEEDQAKVGKNNAPPANDPEDRDEEDAERIDVEATENAAENASV